MLALSAFAIPAGALAQYGTPWPPPPYYQPVTPQYAPPPYAPPQPQGPVAEPWMTVPQEQPQPRWQSPSAQNDRAPALEPIDLPPAIEQGVDMIYIDEELVPRAVQDSDLTHDVSFEEFSGAPVDLFVPVNPIYTELRRGLIRYRQDWGALPQTKVPAGPTLKSGMKGDRVLQLRERFGLVGGDSFDAALAARVKAFQAVHGLKDDGIAGAGTIEALNRGSAHYEQVIVVNMERARRLPSPQEQGKYAVVDAGSARLSLWENGRRVDSMKVVVGKAETATPMMAAYIRHVSVHPYWNVPPELVKGLIAPRVAAQGITYLTEREYQVLADFSENPREIDPATIDWQAVADGRQDVRLRRLPSPANSMGMMKFMLPNYFGIYLHDSPEKDHFTKDELWISNGCVRVEDYRRFARWLFNGSVPQGSNPKVEEDVPLPEPVPFYMTYLTVQSTASGVRFLADHYGRDAALLDRFGQRMASVSGN
ncbi:MAG: L,D-transpeptidase family protein [Sphingomicrobium sp.]